jgi:GTP-binding protein
MAEPKRPQPWQIVEAEFMAAAQAPAQLPPPLELEVAFAGRSNVGKSSLMNAMMDRRRLVRTSSTPGCTRAINFFRARARDGAHFRLVDLPGYGYAKRSKSERSAWGDLIESYLLTRDPLRAVTLLVDARRGMTPDDGQLVELMQTERGDIALVLVATKIDKLAKSKQKAELDKLRARLKSDAGAVIGVSALTGEGIEALWRRLRGVTLEAG